MTIDAIDLLYQGKVDGFGEKKTPEASQAVCTRFLYIDELIANTRDVAPGNKPEAKPKAELADLNDLILAAYREAKRDEKGYALLQQVGQIAGNRSSFDVRNYGFTSLSELFESLDNFDLDRRDNNQIWVKRLR